MQHAEVLRAMSGLLVATFAVLLSSTIVATALPAIVNDLGGSQASITWIMVATMLVATITTPLWGKAADLFDQKSLVQTALVLYGAGSLAAGLAPTTEALIAARTFQGLGVGGLTALVQIVVASMVAPRYRGRYFGYLGAVSAVATVSGPLIGGLVADSPLGWRGCFFVVLPVGAVAFWLLHVTLRLQTARTTARVDVLGAGLLMGGVSLLLFWVTMVGSRFAWSSWTSAVLLGAGTAVTIAAVVVETRVAADPIIPPHLFRIRTVNLVVGVAVVAGGAMFTATVYLSQYLQTARGLSPTGAGAMLVAMVGGVFVTSILSGRRITATGRWKRWIVGGIGGVAVGFALLGTVDARTSLWLVGLDMLLVGLGLGAVTQNLVLSVQNSVRQRDVGAVSGVVNFFRIMGALSAIAVLGAVLSHRAASRLDAGVERALADGAISRGSARLLTGRAGDLPDLGSLPPAARQLYETAFGGAVGDMFLVMTPVVVLALICAIAIHETPLRETIERSDEIELGPV